jgi:mono/diheme cytochrome c family protein
LAVALLAAGGALVARFVREPDSTAVARGREVYQRLGCAGCHGAEGSGGVPNPGSREREVPGFAGGTAMMYVESPAEIREWILDGRPARLERSLAGDDALLQMPAYRGRVAEGELADLIAYYRAVAWYEPDISEAARTGRRAARRHGCFGCHGPSGLAGVANPGSFKGYVPGWAGADFAELVRSEEELRQWIVDGSPARLRDHPVARRFIEGQVIRMPSYRDVLSAEELDAILAYIRFTSQSPWTNVR